MTKHNYKADQTTSSAALWKPTKAIPTLRSVSPRKEPTSRKVQHGTSPWHFCSRLCPCPCRQPHRCHRAAEKAEPRSQQLPCHCHAHCQLQWPSHQQVNTESCSGQARRQEISQDLPGSSGSETTTVLLVNPLRMSQAGQSPHVHHRHRVGLTPPTCLFPTELTPTHAKGVQAGAARSPQRGGRAHGPIHSDQGFADSRALAEHKTSHLHVQEVQQNSKEDKHRDTHT